MDNKSPSVRSETILFLARYFLNCTPAILNKKLLKSLSTSLTKTSNDNVPEVREASFTALGNAMFIVSEKVISPFLSELDGIRMARIKEFCEKATLTKAGEADIHGPILGFAGPGEFFMFHFISIP
ncbi:unnamed protein product [Protopolystoma xenopodis]|uniref:Uncharacterized protein n=1 Tax=Protopolystoma xenopodis TaxID=117903 RepID=A0A3S5ANY1_9PLAT|nr:unnamed protein product [Protopolystoma xenopodis]